ncbi:Acyltransferase family protein [Grimontia celer]|uniref:Acyltransferase family protein n=1 Tax=Grimontia celer TaxID=1796497 RepID=A0A128EXU9_9GAMM|nr:acyltransferase [Grimontia celer]CZF78831.1 Acyltransferase family protein [Grimontia celer]
MRQELPTLTSMRGFAALIVAFFHARLVLFPQWRGSIASSTQFLEVGFIWVDLFFILSGFVMMHVYRNYFDGGTTQGNWRSFIWLRFSRIYPLFLATVLVLVLWESFKHVNNVSFYGGPLLGAWGINGISAFEGPFNRGDALLANLFLVQGISTHSSLTWNFPAWSLSVEWLSYILFPLIAAMLGKSAKRGFWLPLLMILVFFSMASQLGTVDLTNGLNALFRALCGFSIGMWMSLIVLPSVVKRFANNDITMFAIVAGILYLLHQGAAVQQAMIVYLLFAVLVLFGANQVERRSLFLAVFDNRATRFLGDISYSVYLWHAVVLLVGVDAIHYINPDITNWWYAQTSASALIGAMVGFAVVMIALSSLTYYGLERPMLKWLRHFSKKPSQLESVKA